jgi:hypothetical protein
MVRVRDRSREVETRSGSVHESPAPKADAKQLQQTLQRKMLNQAMLHHQELPYTLMLFIASHLNSVHIGCLGLPPNLAQSAR